MIKEPAISSSKGDLGISLADLYRLSVKQYHAIADAGLLDEDDPVELLEGWLVCKYGPFDAWVPRIVAPPDPSPEEEADGLSLASIWRFKVREYHEMIDAGILTEDDPVELLGGWLIRKMTQKPIHPVTIDLVREAFASRLAPQWYVRTQAPITLPEGEPEPDVVLARGDRRDYLQRHPGPDDIGLVVEVADTSLARDRGIKKQMYARAGIAVYWIVNLVDHQFEVYTEPRGTGRRANYRQRRNYGPDETIPMVLDGVAIGTLTVRELMP